MKIINYFLATAALLYAASATAQQYVSPAGNVALGKNAVASTGTAGLAFDNNEGTRWESSQIDGQWIYVDLEADYALDQLQLVWEGAYAKHYKIFVASELTAEMTDELADDDTANDFSNTGWTLAAEVNEQLEGFPYTYNVDLNAGSHGRYVALQTIERGTPYGTSLYEFRVKSFGEYIADGADEISNIFVTVAPTEIYATETATLSTAAINGKNFRVDDAEINYTSSPEGLVFEGNTVSGTSAGTYSITAASGEISATCELTILDTPTLAGLVIDVDNEQGSTAETYTFTITATNQFGDPYTEEFEKEWIVEGPVEGSWDGNNLTVTSRGKYSVQLKSGDITSNTVTIDVLADGQNLALNKTVASSTEGSINPQNAIDGNEGTQWEYAEPADAVDHTYDAEIVIDLGDNYDINCIHAVWEGASAADYTVTFSTDNSQWTEPTPAFTVTGGAGMINPRHDWLTQEESINARYVKLHSTKAATQYGIKLKELEVYSNGELAPAQLKAIAITADNTGAFIGDDTSGINFTLTLTDQYGAAYTLSPEEEATAEWVVSGGNMGADNRFSAEEAGHYTVKYKVGEIESNEIAVTLVHNGQNIVAIGGSVIASTEGSTNPENAIDGNEGTQWEFAEPAGSVDHAYDAEIVVDLGANYGINCVRTIWEGAAAADYTVTFSTDNETWSEPTPAFTMTGGAGMATRYDWMSQNESVNARYVKVRSTKAATGYGVKIKEIEVYSFVDLANELHAIRLSADKTVGHVNDEYPLSVQLLNIFGTEYTPTAGDGEAEWVCDGGGEISAENVFTATEKGAYDIAYKLGDMTSDTLTINVVASGENIVPAWGRIISQTDGATRSAENAIDGNTGTDWFITGDNGAQEFEAEFVFHFNLQVGNAAKVDALHFNFEGANSCKYDVYYSLTGEDDDWTLWASFEEEPNVAARQDWLYRDELVEMNYVKFVSHKVANGEYGLRLFEMEAYGEGNDLSSGVETITAGNGSIYMVGDEIILPAVMDEVLVYNISGTLAATAENTDRIDASALADGIYIVKATDADGNTITAKVIK